MNLQQKLKHVQKIVRTMKSEMEQVVYNSCQELTYHLEYETCKAMTIKFNYVNTFLRNMPGVKILKSGERLISDQVVNQMINKYDMFPREVDTFLCKTYIDDLLDMDAIMLDNKLNDFLVRYDNANKLILNAKLEKELQVKEETTTKSIKI